MPNITNAPLATGRTAGEGRRAGDPASPLEHEGQCSYQQDAEAHHCKADRVDMLRHACGYKLAGDGVDTRALQAYLGHRNIQNTTRYTALAPGRFKGFWRD